jgi:hypothetical protein
MKFLYVYKNEIQVEPAKYHSSYDWLMPVVNKCLKICHDNMLNEWENSFADKFMTAAFEPLYNEAVEFINWFNDNRGHLKYT